MPRQLWRSYQGDFLPADWLIDWLIDCFKCGTNRLIAESSEQCSTAPSEKTKARPCDATVEWTSLAACEFKFRCQYQIATFAYRHFDSTFTPILPFYFTLHISDIIHPPILKWEAFKNPKAQFEIWNVYKMEEKKKEEFGTEVWKWEWLKNWQTLDLNKWIEETGEQMYKCATKWMNWLSNVGWAQLN